MIALQEQEIIVSNNKYKITELAIEDWLLCKRILVGRFPRLIEAFFETISLKNLIEAYGSSLAHIPESEWLQLVHLLSKNIQVQKDTKFKPFIMADKEISNTDKMTLIAHSTIINFKDFFLNFPVIIQQLIAGQP